MRLAVLSDIHGNADALAAVMEDLSRQSPDLTVNLGDCFSGPLDVLRTADLLEELSALTVRGNHDRALVEGVHDNWDAAAAPHMPARALEWMAGLPATARVGEVFLCHATPQDDNTFWLEKMEGGRPRRAPLAAIAAHAEGIAAEVILCGHTHIARTLCLPDGRLIVNPGSVGCPGFADSDAPQPYAISAGAPHAAYAILDRGPQGWSITQRLLPYDSRPARARAVGFPDWVAALASGWAE